MEWKPASIESVRRIVHDDLANCDQKQVAAFEAYRVAPRLAPIVRYEKLENVVVIAQKENHVIYWEDVEEGFGASPISADGQILQHDCNQNDLGLALNAWITGRGL
ncbi:MAG: hypothetical protein WAM13_16370 [Candidatus Sulfotelmatobacter sp.]|jgi:hypothetical protein